jgi:hypothetical protein
MGTGTFRSTTTLISSASEPTETLQNDVARIIAATRRFLLISISHTPSKSNNSSPAAGLSNKACSWHYSDEWGFLQFGQKWLSVTQDLVPAAPGRSGERPRMDDLLPEGITGPYFQRKRFEAVLNVLQ